MTYQTSDQSLDEIAGRLPAGWQWEAGVLSYWDDGEEELITVQVDRDSVTKQVCHALYNAYGRGKTTGEHRGRIEAQVAMQRALGLERVITNHIRLCHTDKDER